LQEDEDVRVRAAAEEAVIKLSVRQLKNN